MFIPALTSSVLIHLAKVSSEGFLYGLPKVISKDPVSAGMRAFRCLVYSSKQLTTHSFVFSLNLWYISGSIGRPGLECFSNLFGKRMALFSSD